MLEDAIYSIYIVLASITFIFLICIAEIITLTRTVLLYRFKKKQGGADKQDTSIRRF
jgi:hypothetical protein